MCGSASDDESRSAVVQRPTTRCAPLCLPRHRSCVRGEGVQGVLALICGGVAQTCHDDRVVELKEKLGIEEVDEEGQEGKVKEKGRGRNKENAP